MVPLRNVRAGDWLADSARIEAALRELKAADRALAVLAFSAGGSQALRAALRHRDLVDATASRLTWMLVEDFLDRRLE